MRARDNLRCYYRVLLPCCQATICCIINYDAVVPQFYGVLFCHILSFDVTTSLNTNYFPRYMGGGVTYYCFCYYLIIRPFLFKWSYLYLQIVNYDSVVLRKHKKSLTHPFKCSRSAYKSVLVISMSFLHQSC